MGPIDARTFNLCGAGDLCGRGFVRVRRSYWTFTRRWSSYAACRSLLDWRGTVWFRSCGTRQQFGDGRRSRLTITTITGFAASRGVTFVYADGSEELYDMRSDANEWENLAGDLRYGDVKREHRRWLPESSAAPAEGSRHRILVYTEGRATWEGTEIGATEPIPEL